MKLCTDCRHIEWYTLPLESDCGHDFAIVISPVDGSASRLKCADMRIYRCGHEAKLFSRGETADPPSGDGRPDEMDLARDEMIRRDEDGL